MDILDEDLGLGRFVYPYEIPYASPTFTGRAAQRERTWQRLSEDGFAGQDGLHGDVEGLLRMWAEPDVLVTQVAQSVEPDARYLYRAGWQGRWGFLCTQRGERLVIDRFRAEHVVPEMVDLLPDWRARPGNPVTVLVPPRGLATDDARKAAMLPAEHFFAAPILRYGVIQCSMRQRDTIARRGRNVPLGSLNWFDTEEGRFFVVTEELPDGAERHTFTPADSSRIAHWLRDRLNRAPES